MRLSQFFDKRHIDVIQWNEPDPGILAYRYPMLDTEIQTGAKLTVRESEMAVFVDQGRIADVFGPGLYTLNAANLPLLTDLKNWKKGFETPFKSDIYFFSTHLEIDQKWGTSTPTTMCNKEFGPIRLRSYGIYSYSIADPRVFFTQVSGTRESYFVYDLDDRLRNTIVARTIDALAASGLSYLDMAANEAALTDKVAEQVKLTFATLGLEMTQFAVQNISLPEEVHESLDHGDAMDCNCCGASMRTDNCIFKCDYCHNVVVPNPSDDGVNVTTESQSRACPICAIPLMQATIGKAPLLYCTQCDGMLVAMEQFEDLVAASRALGGGPIPAQPANPADLQHVAACPRCRRPMEPHFYGGPGNVVIDSCENCSLNWLDHGELARIAHAPVSDIAFESSASLYACDESDSSSYFETPPSRTSSGHSANL